MATPSLTNARYRRKADETDYFTTLNDLDSRMYDVLTSLATIPDKFKALNESYNSFEIYLDDLEEATLGETSFFSYCFPYTGGTLSTIPLSAK